MDSDLALVTELVIILLCIPVLIGAWPRGGPAPASAMVFLLIGSALVAYAAHRSPSGLAAGDVPHAFGRVMVRYFM